MLVLPWQLSAQSAASEGTARDSLPFRPGQWGAEFAVQDFVSWASALRFHAPRQAWVATLSGNFARTEADRRDERIVRAELGLGHRWYRSSREAIAPFVGIGVGAALVDDRLEIQVGSAGSPPAVVGNERLFGIVYGEVGAQWLVTPRLALGAGWQVQASLARNRVERVSASPPSDPPGTSLGLRAQPMALRGTLYF
jgi:hypothetical protein